MLVYLSFLLISLMDYAQNQSKNATSPMVGDDFMSYMSRIRTRDSWRRDMHAEDKERELQVKLTRGSKGEYCYN